MYVGPLLWSWAKAKPKVLGRGDENKSKKTKQNKN
jgi:hypothetical protein